MDTAVAAGNLRQSVHAQFVPPRPGRAPAYGGPRQCVASFLRDWPALGHREGK